MLLNAMFPAVLQIFRVLFLLKMSFSHISLDSVYGMISQPSMFSLFNCEKTD